MDAQSTNASFPNNNNDENDNRRWMSVAENGPRIAFAAYDEETKLIQLEDSYATGFDTQDIAERVLSVTRPTLLLLSNKIAESENLFEVLTTPPPTENISHEEKEDTNDAVSGAGESSPRVATPTPARRSIPYRVMKSSAYEIKHCRSMIMKLQVRSIMRRRGGRMHGSANRRFPGQASLERFEVSPYHALASMIDFESIVQLQALGSLLTFLETTFFGNQGGILIANDIVHMQASRFMSISTDTLSALNIFATEHHPLAASKGYGKSKEGVSLFSLLDRTKSRPGRQRLREIMLKPLRDMETIETRQDGIELFIQPDMQRVVSTLMNLLRNVGAVDTILNRIQKCCTQANDFLLLSKSLTAAISLIATIQQEVLLKLQYRLEESGEQTPCGECWAVDPMTPRYYDMIKKLLQQCHLDNLQRLLERILSVVDEEATMLNGSVVVRMGFNPNLDLWKERYNNLGFMLSEHGEAMKLRWPHLRSVLTVLFMPQVGFIVVLQNDAAWQLDGALPEDFAFVFTEDGASYFKNDDTRELDSSIGDIDGYIKDQEALIVAELEEDIIDNDTEIRDTFNALADLDCTLSFASCASDQKYVRPIVVPSSENCIHIRNGRHPLQEIIIDDAFVANDASLDANHRVNVLTGPNFSGKSCYARQIGVITYMAHIGCFVPCDAAQISIVDQIFARFSSVETCAVPQSSFQLDLAQMGSILHRARQNSLVIIDEFGKGTSPASGLSLLTAALNHLADRGCKVVCTTHFLELFSMGLLVDGENGVRALRMGVHIPQSDQDEATPLFKLETGVATSSAGLVCAKIAGVKDAVIDRANEIIEASKAKRRVAPLTEILRSQLRISDAEREVLCDFLDIEDSDNMTDDELRQFLSKVASA